MKQIIGAILIALVIPLIGGSAWAIKPRGPVEISYTLPPTLTQGTPIVIPITLTARQDMGPSELALSVDAGVQLVSSGQAHTVLPMLRGDQQVIEVTIKLVATSGELSVMVKSEGVIGIPISMIVIPLGTPTRNGVQKAVPGVRSKTPAPPDEILLPAEVR